MDALGAPLTEAAEQLVATVLVERRFGRAAVVSSFGADSAVLLHLVATVDRHAPVLFVDTGRHFAETLAYRDTLVRHLRLTAVRTVRSTPQTIAANDPDGRLDHDDPDRCCALRKVAPLETALEGFDAWLTGRRRHQATTRLGLGATELDAAGRVKVNPLAAWTAETIADHAARHALPSHPLVERGYRSIGCAPCTSPVAAGEDPRAGRWRGKAKVECGLHVVDGRLRRAPVPASAP